jgi:hypothetical protein
MNIGRFFMVDLVATLTEQRHPESLVYEEGIPACEQLAAPRPTI